MNDKTDFGPENNAYIGRLKQLVDTCMDYGYGNYLNLVDRLDLNKEEEKVLNDYFLLPNEVNLDSFDGDKTVLENILKSYHKLECEVIENADYYDNHSKGELKLLKDIMFTEAEIIDFMDYLVPTEVIDTDAEILQLDDYLNQN